VTGALAQTHRLRTCSFNDHIKKKKKMTKFYSSVWDPLLIICQICTMQSVFYLSLGLFLVIFGWMTNVLISLDQFLSFSEITVHTSSGLVTIFSFMATSIIGAVALMVVVERAKKCLDFAATMHIIHLMVCMFYSGFPTNWLWWLLMLATMIVTAVLGEYLCWRREMREIPLTIRPPLDV